MVASVSNKRASFTGNLTMGAVPTKDAANCIESASVTTPSPLMSDVVRSHDAVAIHTSSCTRSRRPQDHHPIMRPRSVFSQVMSVASHETVGRGRHAPVDAGILRRRDLWMGGILRRRRSGSMTEYGTSMYAEYGPTSVSSMLMVTLLERGVVGVTAVICMRAVAMPATLGISLLGTKHLWTARIVPLLSVEKKSHAGY